MIIQISLDIEIDDEVHDNPSFSLEQYVVDNVDSKARHIKVVGKDTTASWQTQEKYENNDQTYEKYPE